MWTREFIDKVCSKYSSEQDEIDYEEDYVEALISKRMERYYQNIEIAIKILPDIYPIPEVCMSRSGALHFVWTDKKTFDKGGERVVCTIMVQAKKGQVDIANYKTMEFKRFPASVDKEIVREVLTNFLNKIEL